MNLMKGIHQKKTIFVMGQDKGYYFYQDEYRKDVTPDDMFGLE